MWWRFLAKNTQPLGTSALAWWTLHDAVPSAIRVVVLGTIGSLLFGAAGALLYGPNAGIVGFLAGLIGGCIFALQEDRPRPQRLRLDFGALRGQALRLLLYWLVIGGGFGGFMTLTFMPVGVQTAWFLGALFGVMIAVLGIFATVVRMVRRRVDVAVTANATESLFADRRNALGTAIAAGVVMCLVVSLAHPPAAGLVCGLAVAFGLGLEPTAWGQWLLLTRFWLPLSGKLPWRLHAFLADAYDRGILRQNGAAWQFRHTCLQAHLSGPTAVEDHHE